MVYEKKLKSFSLTELLVVLVIIGILVLLALPDQSSVISKAKATEAKLQLEHLHALQQAHFYEYSSYTTDLDKVGFNQQPLVTNGGSANYQIEVISAQSGSYLAQATAVIDFDQDGVFNQWQIDQNKNLVEVTKD